MSNAKQATIEWFRTNDPFLFEIARKRYELESGQTLNGFADFFSSLTDTVKNVGSSILQYNSQKELAELQIERAKNNLPPLESVNYVPSVPVTSGGLTPDNVSAAQTLAIKSVQEEAANMKKYLFMGIAGVVVYAVMRGRR